MKKVIIALLVVASLFAFVSCKDEVDKLYKLQPLDVKTEKGAVFFDTLKEVTNDASKIKLTSMERTYYLVDSNNNKSTITYTFPTTKNGHISFKGTFIDTQNSINVTSFECEYDDSLVLYTATDGNSETPLNNLKINDFLEKTIFSPMPMCVTSIVDGSFTSTYESADTFNSTSGEDSYIITKVIAKSKGIAKNQKAKLDQLLLPLSLFANSTDVDFTITYKAVTEGAKEKTLHATLSSLYNMTACTIIYYVKIDGHRYGLPMLSFIGN